MTLRPHHLRSIQNVTDYFQRDPEVQALLLGGSIAHGFETDESDIDLLIFVTEADYEKRFAENRVHFFNTELTTYPGGYVDGKYSSPAFVRQVAEHGSEPARFAFEGARVLFNRLAGFEETVRQAAQYPQAGKAERLHRFYAQFEAWHWYCGEALQKENRYLLGTAVSKFILFSGRLILTYNERLYPYHKWFLRVLEAAPEKPAGLMGLIHNLTADPAPEAIEALYTAVRDFHPWVTAGVNWPTQFMLDSELNWLDDRTPVDDL